MGHRVNREIGTFGQLDALEAFLRKKNPITFDASLLVEESLALCYLKLLRFYKDLFVVLFDENEL
jgi:hypothetical protein